MLYALPPPPCARESLACDTSASSANTMNDGDARRTVSGIVAFCALRASVDDDCTELLYGGIGRRLHSMWMGFWLSHSSRTRRPLFFINFHRWIFRCNRSRENIRLYCFRKVWSFFFHMTSWELTYEAIWINCNKLKKNIFFLINPNHGKDDPCVIKKKKISVVKNWTNHVIKTLCYLVIDTFFLWCVHSFNIGRRSYYIWQLWRVND